MKGEVREALRELVVPQPAEGDRGPDRLRRRFPLGTPDTLPPGRGESPFQFRELTGRFAEDRWDVQGSIEAATADHGGWTARVEMVRVREDDRPMTDAPVPLADLEIDTEGARCRLEQGQAVISADPGVARVDFIGWSRRVDADGESSRFAAGEIELRVTGQLFAGEES